MSDTLARRWLALESRFSRRNVRGFIGLWLVKFSVTVLLVCAGCGPLGPIPGGALSGPVNAKVVEDWSFADDIENAQLETRPADPHSVNTWFASDGAQLYVPTSMILGPKTPTKRSWVAHVDEDNRVRIRLGDTVFERRAIRVEDGSPEYATARAALEARYQIEPEDRDPNRTIWIYRLAPRGN